MEVNERMAQIADLPLRHLERRFSELSAAMTAAGDAQESFANAAITDEERLAQIVAMANSRGIAMGLELAATEVGTARGVLEQALREFGEEN